MIKFQNAATFSIVLKKVSRSRPYCKFQTAQIAYIVRFVTIIMMRTDDCVIVGLTLS